MKVRTIISSAVVAIAAGGAALTAGAAFAQDAPYQAPYGHARLIPVDVSVQIGMHNDRYWDGHRYWAHDEWVRHHPRDRDPWRHADDRRARPHRGDEPHRY